MRNIMKNSFRNKKEQKIILHLKNKKNWQVGRKTFILTFQTYNKKNR